MIKSDDEQEGHINDYTTSKDAALSVREKLRPADMLPTHGGAFQAHQDRQGEEEEDSYKMQMISNKPRAQTTMNYHPSATSGIANGAKRVLSGTN